MGMLTPHIHSVEGISPQPVDSSVLWSSFMYLYIYIYIHSWVYMWDSKTLRLVTRVEMIERPFGHIHIYIIYIYIHSCWRGCNSLFADLDHPGGGPTLMANDFPQTWMLDDDWICGRHCWDASVTTPTSFALLSMWCNLHLASQFRILQGGPFFYSNCRKSFSKIIDIVRTKIDIDTTFWWLLYVFILIFFNSNGKFGRTGYGFLLGLPHKPQGCHIGLI
jgi:hypothetical protein